MNEGNILFAYIIGKGSLMFSGLLKCKAISVYAAAKRAGAIHYALRGKGMDIGVKDSFIAGICDAHNMPFLTRNIKHFKNIPGLKLITIE